MTQIKEVVKANGNNDSVIKTSIQLRMSSDVPNLENMFVMKKFEICNVVF